MIDPTALAGLRPVSLADLAGFKHAANQTQYRGWLHYFPFLWLVSLGGVRKSQRESYWLGDDAGSLCVYRLRERVQGSQLALFLAPMPMQSAVLQRCLQRLRQYNGAQQVSIFRMDGEAAQGLHGQPGVRMAHCPAEYLYQPARYLQLGGDQFSNLRAAVNQVHRAGEVQVLPYCQADEMACLAVHQQWVTAQGSKYKSIDNLTYVRNCLSHAQDFAPADLSGIVVRVNAQVRAFGFFGEMRADMGNLFIAYSDHRIAGLHKFLMLQMLLGLQPLALANSGDAADVPSLAAAKSLLRPVAMHAMCQVYFS